MSAAVVLAALAAVGSAMPATAQDVAVPCRLCTQSEAMSQDKAATPVRLDVETSLDFGRIILEGLGSGTAQLGPDGSDNVSGVVASMGTRAMIGQVIIHGEPNRYLRIDLPPAITLYGFSGDSIRLDSLQSDLPAMPKLDSNGTLVFRFGGKLHIEGEVDGDFRGDVPIDVDYL